MDTKSRLSDSIHWKLYLQKTRIRNKWYESTNAYIYIPYGQVSGYYIITITPNQKLSTFTLSGMANVCVAFFVDCQQETHVHRNRHLTCYMPHRAGRKYCI